MNRLKEALLTIAFALLPFVAITLMLTLRAYAADNEYKAIFETATEADYEALEQVVYWESAVADCKYEVNKAVVETVCNRVLDPDFPSTIYDVCHAKRQFYCKPIPNKVSEHTLEAISDAIAETVNGGREILPSTDYEYFATKKQSCAKDHIWFGDVKDNGKPKKGKGMWFGRRK